MIDKYKIITIIEAIIVVSVTLLILISFRVHNYNEDIIKNKSNSEKNWIIQNYEYYKQYIKTNENGDNTLNVLDFNKSINNHYYSSWHVNDDFDLCLGYYIIENNNGKILVDDSHICDCID